MPLKIDEAALETIQEALLADEQLDVQYKSAGTEKAKALRLHPLGLVQRGPVTFLVASVFKYKNVWLYAMHRFVGVTRTHERVKPLAGFDLDVYISAGALQFGGDQQVELEALVSKRLAEILAETPLSEDQFLVPMASNFACRLRWWIRGSCSGGCWGREMPWKS